MATVEELDYELNFEWDKKSFDKFNKSLKKSIEGFAKLGAAIVAVQGVAFGIAKNVADQNDQLAKLSRRLNTTSEEYQRLKFVAEDFGASGEDVTASLKALTKAQEDVLLGKGDLEAFGRLGINPADFQNSSDLLMAVSDSIKDIQSDSEKINLLERIGVSSNLLQALEGGNNAIRALGKEFDSLGATVTEDQKRVAGEFQAVWLRSTTVVKGITNKVGTDLLRTFNKFLERFVKFSQKNMKQIIAGFTRLFEVVNKVSGFLFNVLEKIFTLLGRIILLMGGLEEAVIAASVAFVILKRRMLLAFAVPLVVATALFLVIEDIVTALEGGDSLFGDWLDAVGQFPLAMEAIGDHIRRFVNDMVRMFKKIGEFFASPFASNFNAVVGTVFGNGQSGQQTVNNGGARTANVTVNVNSSDGNVVDQINTYFQQQSNAIYGE